MTGNILQSPDLSPESLFDLTKLRNFLFALVVDHFKWRSSNISYNLDAISSKLNNKRCSASINVSA